MAVLCICSVRDLLHLPAVVGSMLLASVGSARVAKIGFILSVTARGARGYMERIQMRRQRLRM